ncbi:MAG: hypothetical protein SFU83_23575 [Meiothermus sp.]|nr:hypothetical protein [Meiothermus sp.]
MGRLCHHSGKRKRTYLEAATLAARLTAGGSPRYPYKCPWCWEYHLTKVPQGGAVPTGHGLAAARLQQAAPNNVAEALRAVRDAQGDEVVLRAPGQIVKLRLGFELDGERQTVAVLEMWLYGLGYWQPVADATLHKVLERHGPYSWEVMRESDG